MMCSDNPLSILVLSILKDAKESISLYTLLQEIEFKGYSLLENEHLISQELLLYRKNFILMNSLYQLKRDISGSGYSLLISPLKIYLVSDSPESENMDLAKTSDVQDEVVDIALSEYYLDWTNYDDTDQKAVENLLSGFWRRFSEYTKNHNDTDKRLCALRLLGLESGASWEHIQHAYRQKIAICHPDRGGDSQQFIEIREAFQFLKFLQTSAIK